MNQKRDKDKFPTLKSFAQWRMFFIPFEVEAKNQDVYDVLDPSYNPVTADDKTLYTKKSIFIYGVLLSTLQCDEARAIVRKEASTHNGAATWKALVDYFTGSDHAKIEVDDLRRWFTTVKLDHSWTNSYKQFLLLWADKIREYEMLTDTKFHTPKLLPPAHVHSHRTR